MKARPLAKALASTQFDWDKRRRTIYIALGFCGGVIITVLVYAVTRGNESMLKELASSAWLAAMSIIGAWVFGAAWDDLNARKWGTPQAPADEVPAPDRVEVVKEE